MSQRAFIVIIKQGLKNRDIYREYKTDGLGPVPEN